MKIHSRKYKEALALDSAHFNKNTLDDISSRGNLPWAYDPIAYSQPDRWVYERYVESIYKQFDSILSSKFGRIARLVDLGCGPGGSSLWFALRGYKVLGIDAAEKRINAASQLAARYREQIQQAEGELHFHCGDFFNFDPGPIDAVVSFLTFHHVPEPAYLIDTYLKYLSPNGIFLIYDQIGASIFSYVASGIVAASLPPGTCHKPWIRRAKLAAHRLLVGLGRREMEPGDNPLEGIGQTKTEDAFKHHFRQLVMRKTDPLRIYHVVRDTQPRWRLVVMPWVYLNDAFKKLLPGKEVYFIAHCENLRHERRANDYP